MEQTVKVRVGPMEALGFRYFPRNTAILLTSEPLWAFPGNWYTTYFTFFMAAVGLSALQIGVITSIGLVSKILLSAVGGHITDRLGRKRTLLMFDIICWIIPTAIWAMAVNFWQFTLGVVLNNFVWIATPAWLCLLYEEAPPELRTKISAFNQVVYIVGGFSLPFAGWIIRTHGTVPGIRWLMAGFCFCMILAVIIRGLLVKESSVGLAIKEKHQNVGSREGIKAGWATLLFIFRTKGLRALLFLGILYNFAFNFANTYISLFITRARGLALSKDLLSVFSLLTSSLSLLLIFLIIPRIKPDKVGRTLGVAMAFNVGGFLVFAFSPTGWAPMAWVAIAALAIASGLYIPVREGAWQNLIPDEQRARVIALAASLECIFLLPAAPLGGWLFQKSPRCVYLVGAGIIGLTFLLIARTRALSGNPPKPETKEAVGV